MLRTVWWSAAVLLGAIGLGSVCLSGSLGSTVTTVLIIASLYTVVRWMAEVEEQPDPPGTTRRRFVCTCGWLAAGVVAGGLISALPGSGGWLLLLLVGTYPHLVSGLVRRVTTAELRPAAPGPLPPLAGVRRRTLPADPGWLHLEQEAVQGLTDDQLCWMWRSSYRVIARATTPEQLTHAATGRRAYLDELERRHPAAFRRWVDRGARAASDPAKFLPTP